MDPMIKCLVWDLDDTAMKAADIHVVITDVNRLRDSTPAYSAVWRTFFQWFGQSGTGTLPNLMASEAPDITVRSYLKLLNVKANHRKVVISEKTALVASANVHDASAYHSNIAFETSGEIIGDMLAAEQAAVHLTSSIKLPQYEPASMPSEQPFGKANDVDVRYLSEGKVYKYVLEAIEQAQSGDTLYYASIRECIDCKNKITALFPAHAGQFRPNPAR